MAEAELIVLRDQSPQDQVGIVNRLRAELEEERKAAASGVAEALSMIMRLQEEKASEKMGACQYKRMAEEKLHHAEESMAVLNEVIFQKELEIASLKYQLQNYNQKLMIIGAKDLGLKPVKSNAYRGFKKGSSTFARNISLPAIRLQELLSDIDTTDEYRSLLPDRQLNPSENAERPKPITKNYNADEAHMENHATSITEKYDINEVLNLPEFRLEPVYADRVKQSLYPERIKEDDSTTKYEDILRTETMNLEVERDYSWHPDGEESTFLPKSNEEDVTCAPPEAGRTGKICKFASLRGRSMRRRSDGDVVNPIPIQDIYGIQGSQNIDGLCGTYDDMPQDLSSGANNTNREPDVFLNEDLPFKSCIYAKYENKSPERHKDVLLTTQECRSRTVTLQTDIVQLKDRMQRLQDSGRHIQQEGQEREKEQPELLKRVVEQLDMTRTHFKKPMFDCNQDDDCLLHLVEALSYFWL